MGGSPAQPCLQTLAETAGQLAGVSAMSPLAESGTLTTAADVAGDVTGASRSQAAGPPGVVAMPAGPPALLPRPEMPELSRRGFLRGAALTGVGLVGVGVAACAPNVVPSLAPTAASPIPSGWTEHDVEARNVVRRYIGNLAPALKGIYGDAAFAKLADILGAADGYPELQRKPAFAQVPQLFLNDVLQPLTAQIDGDVKVFRLTIDEIAQKIDEMKDPIAALGYNKQTPGPTIPS